MSPGKIASQTAHATFMALEQENKKLVSQWKKRGMCVIVLKCKDPLQLSWINKYFDTWSIVNHMYIDEGLTEVIPMTPTALATGILDETQQMLMEVLELYD